MKKDNWIRKLLQKGSTGTKLSPPDIAALRTDFQSRYHHFKLLLNANNKALEVMTELEEVLRGSHPFSMSFVRSRTTALSASVFQVMSHLNELAPKKYELLFERFKEIQTKLRPFIEMHGLENDGPPVLPLEEVTREMAPQTGAKAANLGEIAKRLHFPIPHGFIITTAAYQRFLQQKDLVPEIQRRIQAAGGESTDRMVALSASLQQLIIRSPVPSDLEQEIRKQYVLLEEKAGNGVRVAMRSSALGEDSPGLSFAGQYRSELNVSGEHLLEVYKEIIASKYSLQAMAYRLNRGIRDEDVAMGVACMAMIEAVAGGVAYSTNPGSTKDNTILINAVWGLPKAVVDGSMPADLFIISRDSPLKILVKETARKEQKLVCSLDEGVRRLPTAPTETESPSLTDEQAVELGRMVLRVEELFGIPLDVEWALDKEGAIVLLQCRPLLQSKTEGNHQDMPRNREKTDRVILNGGVSASPGAGAGPVFLVRKHIDLLRFPDGAVLAAAQALPQWAPLLNRAAALVTEQGGITGHLATVAREFGVPALFGLKNALTLLKNGDMVTVDANTRTVYEGRIHSLLHKSKILPGSIQDSPVHQSLRGASQHIIPLHLLDPDAVEFSPAHCKTFHDITRFCHEKAVFEMFRFGKDHPYPERSSKQLYCDGPMQFWIINLDDGFTEEVTGHWILLENICSIPMLSLWQGMTAVPWEGPPPVDSKGFLSVLFQSTTNPALDPSTGRSYGIRNYFMISKNFCTLQSRFGFHFSTVEALVGERPLENYVSFQFKGGAADLRRRVFRAQFLSELLDHYGFRTEIRGDALFARMERYEQPFLEKRLRILGYLIIHTRQLDMIMANRASINHQRRKITADLRAITGSQ